MPESKKSQATILLNPKKTLPTTFDSFLSRLFYKKITNREHAEIILSGIVQGKDIYALKEEKNISNTTFYDVLKRLKALGLIKKEKGIYYPSKIFSIHLKNLANWWDSYMQENYAKERLMPIREDNILEEEIMPD